MAVNDVYQLSVVHVLNGRETSNLFYYKETALAGLDPKTIAAVLSSLFFDEVYSLFWQPHVTVRGRLTAIWAKRIWPTFGEPATQPFVTEPGGIGGDSCPNNAAALISMGAANRSRNFQRRSYISGIPESRQIGAEITVVQAVAMRNLGDAVVDTVFTLPCDPQSRFTACAFSKKLAAAADPDPSELLTRARVQTDIRSMRQRNLFKWKKT